MAARRRRSRFRHDEESWTETHEPRAQRPEVDLHGCTVESATRRVAQALTRCRAGGGTSLLVITGRGHGSHGGNGVLRPAMLRWLKGAEAQSLGAGGVRELQSGGALEVAVARRSR